MPQIIHYKAYIKKFNKVADVISLNFLSKEAYFSNWVDPHQSRFSFNEIELMQGLNLPDQFGNEIFEGFRVKATNVHTKKESTYTVKHIVSSFLFSDDNCKTWCSYDDLVNIEIVGNIYIDDSESVWERLKFIV